MEPTMKEFPRPLRRSLFFYQMASSGVTREAATAMIEPVETHQRPRAHYDGSYIQVSATNPIGLVALTRVFTGRGNNPITPTSIT